MPCDVEQFFPAIDHQILRSTLFAKITDGRVCHLIDRILAGGANVLTREYDMRWFPGDDLTAALRPRGLPIGNLTSQFWANCYLNPLDHFIKRELRCRGFARYVDDFLLFAHSKQALWDWQRKICRRLESFRLTIHPGAHPRPVSEGIPFLGWVVSPSRRRLKRRKGIHFRRKLQHMLACYRAGDISFEELTAGVQGWINHVRYGNTTGLRKAVLGQAVVLSPERKKQ